MKYFLLGCFFILPLLTFSQAKPADQVNVFLGSSGDHGQLSPAASYPFSMLSIGPQTYPGTHTGYDNRAKKFHGFTHNRFEGVGCMGSGGNILIKPFLGDNANDSELIKVKESGSPGYYGITFSNQINAEFTVYENSGRHRYRFPSGKKGFYLDLSHSFVGRFIKEEHDIDGSTIKGWIEAKTTCDEGVYRIYYYLDFNQPVEWLNYSDHQFSVLLNPDIKEAEIKVGFSSTSTAYAKASCSNLSFDEQKRKSAEQWDQQLGRITVKGDLERERLFYSLLYRSLQSPYIISEPNGTYRAIDSSLHRSDGRIYNGWAIWDNYRTQLPLLSLAYPERYADISTSIANLYRYGKKNFATLTEPSPTVRTEHAMVVLLDAYRKGYKVDFKGIQDSLVSEAERLDYSSPDKALESSYDAWALSQIFTILKKKDLSEKYKDKSRRYKTYWNKDFKDLQGTDVDRMQARGLYQGTIWQYRWFVPFDVKGLIGLTGGEKNFSAQLDRFFENDYYNHANEPDLQAPLMYNATANPWKSQALIHKIAVDTIVQHYFNDNSRGIGSFVDRVYKNEPEAYIRTMDDDAGAMSSWFIFASAGIFPASVGWPVYYLHVPLFPSLVLNWEGEKPFSIKVENYGVNNVYIKEVILNGKKISRNWISHQEIRAGGGMIIIASDLPNKDFNPKDNWIPELDMKNIK